MIWSNTVGKWEGVTLPPSSQYYINLLKIHNAEHSGLLKPLWVISSNLWNVLSFALLNKILLIQFLSSILFFF